MAKGQPAAPAAQDQGPVTPTAKVGGKTMVWLIGSLVFFAALAIGLGSPTLLLFMIVGFAPTVAAGLIDEDPEKHSAIAVGAMSVAAMIPLILGQLTASSSSGYSVLGDSFAWLTVYGAAGIGWAIHAAVPAVTLMLSDMRADWKRKELKKLQDSLVEEWGQDVMGRAKR